MLISKKVALGVALVASSAVVLAACGSSSKGGGKTGGNTVTPSSNPLEVGATKLDAQSGANGTHGTGPKTGGTLKFLGASDVDYLDTSSAYYTVSYTILRTDSRQLVTYPNSVDPAIANAPVADLATTVPTPTANGTVYSFDIKPGAQWNAPTGARQVTGADEVRGIKRLCNPVSPSGGLAYYTATIKGMATFCTGFGKVKQNVAAIKAYMDSNQISGIVANGNNVTFTLNASAGDFLNIMALPFASPAPVEVEQYLPISDAYNQHTISDGPYQITKYVPNSDIELARNPAWKASTDAVRHAYVNAISVKQGSDEEPVQQALETGDADMEWDTGVPAADLPALNAKKDPHLSVQNVGSTTYAVLNLHSTTDNSALGKTAVRQALQYCVAKSDIVQIEGGSSIATPIDQILTPPILGYKQIDPYNNLNGNEDSAKGAQMLSAAGYPSGLSLKFLYRASGKSPSIATALQADMKKCGVKLDLVQTTSKLFYAGILEDPSKSSTWDIAVPGWNPDWQGNAARSFFVPLLSPNSYQTGTTNYGGYGDNVPGLQNTINAALAETDPSKVASDWAALDASTMQNAPWIPLVSVSIASYYGANVSNWVFFNFSNNGDPTNVWLTNG